MTQARADRSTLEEVPKVAYQPWPGRQGQHGAPAPHTDWEELGCLGAQKPCSCVAELTSHLVNLRAQQQPVHQTCSSIPTHSSMKQGVPRCNIYYEQGSCWIRTYVKEEAAGAGLIISPAGDLCCGGVDQQQGLRHSRHCLHGQHAHHVFRVEAQDAYLQYMQRESTSHQ